MEVKSAERLINIKNLVIEEPQRKPQEFDARTFLSEDEWQNIVNYLSENLISNDLSGSQLEAILSLKRINADKFEEFMQLSKKGMLELSDNIIRWSKDIHQTLTYLEFFKEVFPQKFNDLYRDVDNRGFNETDLVSHLESERSEMVHSSEETFRLLVAFPETPTPAFIDDFVDDHLTIINYMPADPGQYTIYELISQAVFAVLHPDLRDKLEIISHWEIALNLAEHYRQWPSDYISLLRVLTCLQILKSKETRFTEAGLQIFMPEPKTFEAVQQELPQTRKF